MKNDSNPFVLSTEEKRDETFLKISLESISRENIKNQTI